MRNGFKRSSRKQGSATNECGQFDYQENPIKIPLSSLMRSSNYDECVSGFYWMFDSILDNIAVMILNIAHEVKDD